MTDESTPRRDLDRIFTARLLGLADRRLDLALTLAAAALLAASRLLLLANGPWEQDEAIFARSVLAFAPAQHFPHPPFFPGWIAAGFALTPLLGDPLRAFQLLSAAASVAAVWPLAFLGRRVAPPAVALASALAVSFLPGTWVFAVRGFSCTAAALLALAAAAMAVQGLDGMGGRRFLVFSLLVAVAFLVRPVLAPLLALLWLAAARGVHPRGHAVLAGAAGAALAAVGFLPFVIAAGGPGGFAALLRAHAGEHFGAVAAAPTRIADIGVVCGLGGVAPAAAAAVLALAGLAAWWRRAGWRPAAVYAVLVAGLVLSLLYAHVPTFPRYAVPLLLALAPLFAGALAWLPAAAGAGVALAAGAASAAAWLPLLVEQHTTRFPMWAAAVTACERARDAERPTRVLGGRGGWAFVSYSDELMRARGEAGSLPRPDNWPYRFRAPVGAEHWLVVTSGWSDILPWERTREVARFAGVSWRAERLSQHRFLTATVVADLPLQHGTWWRPEKDGKGRTFAWSSSPASITLPAAAAGEPWVVQVRAARGELPLRVAVNRKLRLLIDGGGRTETHRVPPEVLFTDRENIIELSRDATYPPNERDRRPLAAALYVVAGGAAAGGATVGLGDDGRLRELGITLAGFHGRETFRDGVVGRWSQPTAAIEVPAAAGTLALTLLAPRPGGARTEVWAGGARVAGPWEVTPSPRSFEVVITPALVRGPSLRLELRTNPYEPPSPPGRKSRLLGVVVSSLTLPNPAAAP
jgi:hypothetical protein